MGTEYFNQRPGPNLWTSNGGRIFEPGRGPDEQVGTESELTNFHTLDPSGNVSGSPWKQSRVPVLIDH